MRDILIDLNEYTLADIYADNILREGENNASQLIITLNTEFTGYSYRLNFQLNDLTPYNSQELTPVLGIITFPISNVFTFVNGVLKVELQAYDINDTLVKSATFLLKIKPAIDGVSVVIPPEYDTFLAMGAPSIPDVDSTLVKRGIDGNFGISLIDFSDVPAVAETTRGRLQWDNIYKTLVMGLEGNVGSMQLGQEYLIYARNNSGVNLPVGTPVYITGSIGDLLTVAKADISDGIAKTYVIGVAGGTSGINNNTNGYVLTNGIIHNFNTNAFNEGDPLWLSLSGTLTNVMPTIPSVPVFIGWCIKKATAGKIYVNVIRREIADEILLRDTSGYFVIKNVEGALA